MSTLEHTTKAVSTIHGYFHRISWPVDAYLYHFRGLLHRIPPSDFPERWNPMRTEINSSDVVIEAGANLGGLTRVIARYAKEVHSFEPSPKAFHYLTKNTQMCPNVFRYNMGIEDKWKEVPFNIEWSFSGANSIYHIYDSGKWSATYHAKIKATFISIDEFCAWKDLKPSILSLDCEGSEIHALEGAKKTLSSVRKVFCETHYADKVSTAPKVKELLEENNFTVSRGWDSGNILWLIGKKLA